MWYLGISAEYLPCNGPLRLGLGHESASATVYDQQNLRAHQFWPDRIGLVCGSILNSRCIWHVRNFHCHSRFRLCFPRLDWCSPRKRSAARWDNSEFPWEVWHSENWPKDHGSFPRWCQHNLCHSVFEGCLSNQGRLSSSKPPYLILRFRKHQGTQVECYRCLHLKHNVLLWCYTDLIGHATGWDRRCLRYHRPPIWEWSFLKILQRNQVSIPRRHLLHLPVHLSRYGLRSYFVLVEDW